jgi:cytoskeleton protein RodZ
MAQDHDQDGALPLLSAGARLREARLAAGLEIEEIAARTRVSRRHLEAIEEDRFSQLASRTYAVGFSRSYARALGLNEDSIAKSVREEITRQEELNPRPLRGENFEPGDPARVPSSSLAWLAGGGAILLLGVLFVLWRSYLSPAAPMPDLVKVRPSEISAPDRPGSPKTVPSPPVAATGTVRLTALADGVWIKVSDAAGEQLFQKELVLGESYTVPAGARGPVLATARPDVLRVTIGARVLGSLRPEQEIVRNVSLEPASLLAPAAPPASATDAPPAGETSTVSVR